MRKCAYDKCGNATENPKYCSRSCAATVNNLTPKRVKKVVFCKSCSVELNRTDRSYCAKCWPTVYSSRSEARTLQEVRAASKNQHSAAAYSSIRQQARSKFKDIASSQCARCGYHHHVELCHIRAIRDFPPEARIGDINSRDNIIQLCPNCHWEFDNGMLSLGDIGRPTGS